MEERILLLEKKLKRQKYYLSLILCSFVLALFLINNTRYNDIIKTKGIIIVDEDGRDRILIGSPIPSSADRVRTDLDEVREFWAQRMGGEKYMEYYQDYDHSASGIVFLNELGFDRLIVGDHHPDPNTGKRMVSPTGITWNDDLGFERGGLGITKTDNDEYRVMLGMDDHNSNEALHLFILEDGTKAMRIAHEDGYMLMGYAKKGNFLFQNDTLFSGYKFVDKDGKTLLEKNAYDY